VSLKKLRTGDGSWGTQKLILGWIVDSDRQSIELILTKNKCSTTSSPASKASTMSVPNTGAGSILGKLRFVSLAIPGSAGLFSALLQWAQNQAGNNQVRLNAFVQASLAAFGRLAASLCSCPTNISELDPKCPPSSAPPMQPVLAWAGSSLTTPAKATTVGRTLKTCDTGV
jgi:hypothetical protein